ncbi:hypothetical protein Pint_27251 [Pistacia integerrima]|uniref:Uncharacterized protein n=1 Tax=Pistacia integerrima TaxID=434235 RepID=A0ACC0YVA3_9ROSI|nr:hypothetical protein Pint_27251 [Pistacia integerrima]
MSTTEREYFWKVVSEKITVFTTNYKERIDPALLRPGRMDKLIGEVKVSPADVAGEFMRVKSSKNFLEDLVKFMETKESEERSSDAAEQENDNNSNQKTEGNLWLYLKLIFSKHGYIVANTTFAFCAMFISFGDSLWHNPEPEVASN